MPSPTDNRSRAYALFTDYLATLEKAEALHREGRLEAAAVFAAMAAHKALRPHSGFFSSPRIERMLVDIGRRNADETPYRRATHHKGKVERILHVATEVAPVGGLTNMLRRWIDADDKRVHSVALTRHRGAVVPSLAEAVMRRGGKVHRLNKTAGGQIAWAKKLRELARENDAVVLHTYSQDVIPAIAFANPETLPPVLLLNHGDHLFWLGVSTSDVVINLRDAAQDLSIARRGVPVERNVMVPTIVAPAVRSKSRAEAKAALGLEADSVLMFSAARAMKYRTVEGRTFADPHVELLKKYPKAQLIVLGAGTPEDWKTAIASTGGRIKPLPESPEAKVYFEAADIYVDSFPFVSSTSLMEAAGLGTPLVSRFYGPKEARIFAINHPGIDRPTLHGANETEYVGHLDRLIADPALREAKGEEARLSVLHYHTPPSWLGLAEEAYERALKLPPVDPMKVFAANATETFSFGEPDCRLYEVFGFDDGDMTELMKAYVGLLPTPERIAFWNELRSAGAYGNPLSAARFLMPEWLVRNLKDRSA